MGYFPIFTVTLGVVAGLMQVIGYFHYVKKIKMTFC